MNGSEIFFSLFLFVFLSGTRARWRDFAVAEEQGGVRGGWREQRKREREREIDR